jgi:bacteriocin biosynthesis cyclodehydratase domain-containing protein
LLGLGPFGARVVEILSGTFPDSRMVGEEGLEDGFASSDAVVVALWRPAPALCERADLAAHKSGTPWLPIIMRHPLVLVGPLVRPGRTPCFRCYQQRLVQHDKDWRNTRDIHAAYDRDPDCGPRGFLPQHGRMAAGIAARLLGGRHAVTTGEVISFSLVEQRIRKDAVLSCHGCARCGASTVGAGLAERLADVRRANARSI